MTIGGGEPDREWLDTLIDTMGLETAASTGPRRCRAASSSGRGRSRADQPPGVVFADEPTGNLDSAAGGEILELLRRAVDEFGQTIVMVTHDAGAAAIADRVLFLADGEIVDEHEGLSIDQILDHLKALR